MPLHDWTRVRAGTFHHFHQSWIQQICNSLNGQYLPKDHFAITEQSAGGPIPDVLALRMTQPSGREDPSYGGTAVATAPPRTRFQAVSEIDLYSRKADRLAIRHADGTLVAVMEIVSPGNKASHSEFDRFTSKIRDLIRSDVNILIIDVFPPTKRDPRGIHAAIWNEIADDDTFSPPPEKPLTVVSYHADLKIEAYIEPVAVGDVMPVMPLFLGQGRYINLPLEPDYESTWALLPQPLKDAFE